MIRLIKPYLDYAELEPQFAEIINSGLLTKGYYSKHFPEMLKTYTGSEHAFLTTSATTALTMALKTLNIGPGDEVIVSDFSFPASANVIEDLGAKPVFADVSLETYNMQLSELEAKVNPNTKAVMFVDALGNPSGLLEISKFCKDHAIPLVEDAACALGSSVGGQVVGKIADLTCLSFHPRKLLTCGEGGAITTDNPEYAQFLSYKLNHGADATGDFISYGYNYRLPELACCMGCSQIEKLNEIVDSRIQQAQQYAALLEPLGFVAQKIDANVRHNKQSVVFLVPDGINRDDLINWLKQAEIESTIGTYCLSACTYYLKKYDSVQPNAFYLQNNTITLPCYTDVPVIEVCQSIQKFMDRL